MCRLVFGVMQHSEEDNWFERLTPIGIKLVVTTRTCPAENLVSESQIPRQVDCRLHLMQAMNMDQAALQNTAHEGRDVCMNWWPKQAIAEPYDEQVECWYGGRGKATKSWRLQDTALRKYVDGKHRTSEFVTSKRHVWRYYALSANLVKFCGSYG